MPSSALNVIVRIRPTKETQKCISMSCEGTTIGSGTARITCPSNHQSYEVDRCYDERTTQQDLFQQEIEPHLSSILAGKTLNVFSYGATGTGKTFTMEGDTSSAAAAAPIDSQNDSNVLGIVPRSIQYLLRQATRVKDVEPDYTMKVSMFEIYNEKIYDLLTLSGKDKGNRKDLPLRQNAQGRAQISGLSQHVIEDPLAFQKLYSRGCTRRSIGATKLNTKSSRSHSILQITIHHHQARQASSGKCSFIDLAGNEDNRKTGNKGQHMMNESGKINLSLFALGNVITALNSNNTVINYRDSKLTRLLQETLKNHSTTGYSLMICTVSPRLVNIQETCYTLNYAAKARTIVAEDPDGVYKSGLKPKTKDVKPLARQDNLIKKLELWKAEKKHKRKSSMGASGATSQGGIPTIRTSTPVALSKKRRRTMSSPPREESVNHKKMRPTSSMGVISRAGMKDDAAASSSSSSRTPRKLPTNVSSSKSPRAPLSRMHHHQAAANIQHKGTSQNEDHKNNTSDASTLTKAKVMIASAVQHKKNGKYQEALALYQKAQVLLPTNGKLRHRIADLKEKMIRQRPTSVSSPTEDHQHQNASPVEHQLLQILNQGTLKQVLLLQGIGKKRATMILGAREPLFLRFSDLSRIGLTTKQIDKIVKLNIISLHQQQKP